LVSKLNQTDIGSHNSLLSYSYVSKVIANRPLGKKISGSLRSGPSEIKTGRFSTSS
jgi:hypothetical protein